MTKNLAEKKFAYKNDSAYFRTRLVPILGLMISFTIIIISLIVFPKHWLFYTAISVFLLAAMLFTLIYYFMYPNIIFEEDKIFLEFAFKTYSVNVNEIVRAVELDMFLQPTILRVDFKRLSRINKLVGLVYGSNGLPSILVKKEIHNYNELLKVLSINGLIIEKRLW